MANMAKKVCVAATSMRPEFSAAGTIVTIHTSFTEKPKLLLKWIALIDMCHWFPRMPLKYGTRNKPNASYKPLQNNGNIKTSWERMSFWPNTWDMTTAAEEDVFMIFNDIYICYFLNKSFECVLGCFFNVLSLLKLDKVCRLSDSLSLQYSLILSRYYNIIEEFSLVLIIDLFRIQIDFHICFSNTLFWL